MSRGRKPVPVETAGSRQTVRVKVPPASPLSRSEQEILTGLIATGEDVVIINNLTGGR